MEGDGCGGCGGVSPKEDAAVADGQMTEDEKMEKFYELIRNYKRARERRRIEQERALKEEAENDDEDAKRRKRKRIERTRDRAVSSWIPAFKWEDFREDSQIRFRRSPVISPTYSNDVHSGGRIGRADDTPPSDVDGGGLDLRLRL